MISGNRRLHDSVPGKRQPETKDAMYQPPQLALASTMLFVAAGPALAASFVYEGRLDDYGQPANGHFDLRVGAFSERHLGAIVLAPTTFFAVPVVDGQFRLEVELPLAETDDVWIEAAVREQGGTDFSAIPGRSKAVSGTIGQCWSTAGDAGSNPATNFLGTTDAQPLVLRTRNAASLRLEPSAELFNSIPITANVIAGSSANLATSGVRGATIAGGGVPSGNSDPLFSNEAPNSVTDHYGTVGGGFANQSGDGAGSATDSAFATVAGGRINLASGTRSSVGGGAFNTAVAADSSVSGGFLNTASGSGSSVLGGTDNTASGVFSVASGAQNCAGGAFSWAGGHLAKIRPGTSSGAVGSGCVAVTTTATAEGDEGTFVWSDQSGSAFTSSGPNQFLVRAANGFGLNTNTPLPSHVNIGKNDGTSNFLALGFSGAVTRWRIAGPAAGAGSAFEVQSGGDELLLRVEDAGTGSRLGIARDPQTNTLEVEGNASKTTSGSWLANSDARIKTEVQEIDDALARLLRLRPVTFRYTAAYRAAHPGIADQTYYNVIAQEFARVFPEAVQGSGEYLPNAERTAANEIQQVDVHPALITTIAAVQELALRLEAERKLLDGQLRQLAGDNAALREAAARNEARLARLESMLAPGGR
ncbi:MAG: tail fiber domain-containing protein [Xanthomonadales bacterium]|nr:tail fiber domain-containing protein [Xanthomonadales bacterium]